MNRGETEWEKRRNKSMNNQNFDDVRICICTCIRTDMRLRDATDEWRHRSDTTEQQFTSSDWQKANRNYLYLAKHWRLSAAVLTNCSQPTDNSARPQFSFKGLNRFKTFHETKYTYFVLVTAMSFGLWHHAVWYISSSVTADRKSRDSIVGRATGYGLGDQEVGVRVPVGSRIFTSPRRPDRLWGPPNLLSNRYRGFFPRG
jgi:hypothetical protein